jgi:small subunit ribosomal protein S17|tara:strand:- start:588 stop:962 length:375 start_codon:yes stop_codon:yes gene_type:complete
MTEKEKKERKVGNGEKIVGTADLKDCKDVKCHVHGNLKTRGRTFEGTVIKKFPKRIVIGFERMIYIRKYERYAKSKTKIHARLPDCMKDMIRIGDLVKIRECRPLSKIIHFITIGKVNKENKGK